MTTLAPKLPWTHPFAGGYPRVAGQQLPTDSDAIDYLERVKAADGGAAVEVGVAMAVDQFVKGCKADGTWSALQAACIMCGARTISGALVPLVGDAPTAYSFASGDYQRGGATPGLKGDGSTKYLDSGRAITADDALDQHASVYLASYASGTWLGSFIGGTGYTSLESSGIYCGSATLISVASGTTGFVGCSRTDNIEHDGRRSGETVSVSNSASIKTLAANYPVFAYRPGAASITGHTSARLAFYSIGSALDLAALDARVTALVTAIGAAI